MSTTAAAARLQRQLDDLLKLPGNDRCADCRAPAPRWASVNLGVFLCVQCASIHRKMGTHTSRVKSVTMDTWTREQIEGMRSMGNIKANSINVPDQSRNPPPTSTSGFADRDSEMEKYIRRKYEYGAFKARATHFDSLQGTSQSRPESRDLYPSVSGFSPKKTHSELNAFGGPQRTSSPANANASSSSSWNDRHQRPLSGVGVPLSPSKMMSAVENSAPLFSGKNRADLTNSGRKAAKSHVESNWNDFLSSESAAYPNHLPARSSSKSVGPQSQRAVTPDPPKQQSGPSSSRPRAATSSAPSAEPLISISPTTSSTLTAATAAPIASGQMPPAQYNSQTPSYPANQASAMPHMPQFQNAAFGQMPMASPYGTWTNGTMTPTGYSQIPQMGVPIPSMSPQHMAQFPAQTNPFFSNPTGQFNPNVSPYQMNGVYYPQQGIGQQYQTFVPNGWGYSQ